MNTRSMNRFHLDGCVCFSCTKCRPRYTKKEWNNTYKDKICRWCGKYGGSHAADWTANNGVMAGGSCHIGNLEDNKIKSKSLYPESSSNSDRIWSFDYVYDPVDTNE